MAYHNYGYHNVCFEAKIQTVYLLKSEASPSANESPLSYKDIARREASINSVWQAIDHYLSFLLRTGPVEHYCPITFGQKIDPQGQYVRAYVPELQNFPSE